MKKILYLSLLLFLTLASIAQKKAVTETGEEVILYEDGTWKYLNDSTHVKNEILVNPKKFAKNDNSTFLLKSTKTNIGIWLDSKKWSFKKSGAGEVSEYGLQSKEKDLYAMLITEKIEIALESLEEIALTNAKEAAPDTKIIKHEYRTVNGKKVLHLQMTGTIQGIKFIYSGYYYSSPKGTVQFLAYTSQNLFKDYEEDIDELLNGMVTLD
ncbi:MAG: hypothetical protein Q8941_10635 [Bacteroidota bacterium]|nr:hypothetical protein [Bacteroidota bacterium]